MNEKMWYASLQNDFQDVLSKKIKGQNSMYGMLLFCHKGRAVWEGHWWALGPHGACGDCGITRQPGMCSCDARPG